MSGGASTVVDFPFNLKVVFMAGSWRVVLSDRGQVYASEYVPLNPFWRVTRQDGDVLIVVAMDG
jgi:hypothetical protein